LEQPVAADRENMTSPPPPSRSRSVRIVVVAGFTAGACAALLLAAALTPAPALVMPFVVAVCVACPMLAAFDLPRAFAGFRHHRERIQDNARAVAELRAGLAELPETSHPFGF
jgi:hypothetical protein